MRRRIGDIYHETAEDLKSVTDSRPSAKLEWLPHRSGDNNAAAVSRA
jgi:hypothetical protein